MKTHPLPPRNGFSVLKFLFLLAAVLVVGLLVFLTFFLSPAAKWAANHHLPGILGAGASVETVEISLWTGEIRLGGVRIADPSDDPEAPDLLALEELVIDIDTGSVFGDTVRIPEVRLVGPALHASRSADGTFSFERLKIMRQAEEPGEEDADSKGAGKAVRIDVVSVERLGGSFSDETADGAKTSFSIEDFTFLAKDITANPGGVAPDLPPGIGLASVVLSDARIEYRTEGGSGGGEDRPAAETAGDAPEDAPRSQPGADASGEEAGNGDPADPVHIGRFEISDFAFRYANRPRDGDPLDLRVEKFLVRVNDLVFDPGEALTFDDKKIMTAEMGFEIDQPEEEVGPAYFGAVVKSGVIGKELPAIDGRVQLTGFEFATIASIVPRGVQSAIGGYGFDMSARWFVFPDKLDGSILILSSRGATTHLSIGGTPDKPRIEGPEALLNLLDRPGQILGAIAGDALSGGVEVAFGAADAAGRLATGAGDTVMGFGKGILDTGKGLLSGDLKEAGRGLGEATVGTVRSAGRTVGESTDAAAGGVEAGVSAGSGGKRRADWRAAGEARHEAFEEASRKWLEEDNFPPAEPDGGGDEAEDPDPTGGDESGGTDPAEDSGGD
ncbi:MAG: hypothetical protein ACLFSZ_00190 [Puniceicoccaceae bacterium]